MELKFDIAIGSQTMPCDEECMIKEPVTLDALWMLGIRTAEILSTYLVIRAP